MPPTSSFSDRIRNGDNRAQRRQVYDWKGHMMDISYQEYLQTDEWKTRRLGCLKRDGYRCRVCNGTENLEVHHRTYERIGQELEDDLTTLCESCHAIYT